MKKYKEIIKHYESCLEKHGDNHLGVDWPKIDDIDKRYHVMLDMIRLNLDKDVTLLDFGCGTAHLLEFIHKNKIKGIEYSGLDISQKFVDIAKSKFPKHPFFCIDFIESYGTIENFDYIVMNGVFTEKRELSFDEMWDYFTQLINIVFEKCEKGFAFNVMSKNVDWERDDLFHVSLDMLSNYLCKNLTRNFVIRNDYGLYEYTTYVLKN
ncbi:class I SAM-dependent methyltransferase [Crocinitomicaceae bacterium]|nr:class I SAM-dependent methyltransferase [Crocinitomicaceae bacterium]